MRTPHGAPIQRRFGLGDAAAAVTSGAALVAWLTANGCTQSSVPAVSQFQTDYNSSGLAGQLTVDGQYGPNTQTALQNVLGSNGTAPDNCFGGTPPTTPALDSATGITTSSGTTVAASSSSPDYSNWIIGGAAILGVGIVGFAYWRHKHPRRR